MHLTGREERDLIITPHPGEMARLIGASIADVQANRIEVAADFATTHRVYVVLKGHRTVIATPEGRVYINPTGNPGMATGGTGDVLTGMIAAWLAQLLDAEAACRLAVFLHGAAGDLAEANQGQVGMMATDLARPSRQSAEGARRASQPVPEHVTTSEAETAGVARRSRCDSLRQVTSFYFPEIWEQGRLRSCGGWQRDWASIPRMSAARRLRWCMNTVVGV